jgi:hypothetical protein
MKEIKKENEGEDDPRGLANLKPTRVQALRKPILKDQQFFLKIENFSFSQVTLQQEFKIPGEQRDHPRRYQDRRPTSPRGALKGPLCSDDLVMTDVSVEILTSRIGRDALGAILNPVSKHDAKMSKWLNKWIVPLLVAFVTLAALAIAAFVSYGVHLLR